MTPRNARYGVSRVISGSRSIEINAVSNIFEST
jgi:hypothetical protein